MTAREKLILFCLSFIYLLIYSTTTSPICANYGMDSIIFKIMGEAWLHGTVIYRDLFDHKGPYLYLFQLIGLALPFGRWGVLLLQVINLFLVLVVLFKTGLCITKNVKNIWVGVFAFFIMFLATIDCGNYTEEWSLLYAVIPMLFFFQHYKDDEITLPIWKTVVMGFCFGVIAFIRLNNAIINSAVAITFFIAFITQKKYQVLCKHVVAFIIGFILATLPFVIYFMKNDALDDMLQCVFLFNLKYSNSFKEVTYDLILKNLIMIAPILLSLIYVGLKKQGHWNSSLNIYYYILSLITTFVFYKLWGYSHYYTLLLPTMFVLVVTIFSVKFKLRILRYIILFTCLFPYVFVFGIRTNVIWGTYITYTSLKNLGNSIFYSTEFSVKGEKDLAYDEIISIIPVRDRDKIYSYEMLCLHSIFLRAGVIPTGKYFFMQSQLSKVDNKVKEDIDKRFKLSNPAYVLVDKKNERSFITKYGTKYTKIFSSKHEGTPIIVYRRSNISFDIP